VNVTAVHKNHRKKKRLTKI